MIKDVVVNLFHDISTLMKSVMDRGRTGFAQSKTLRIMQKGRRKMKKMKRYGSANNEHFI